jgi:carbamoyl-phosphate synthase large subunit
MTTRVLVVPGTTEIAHEITRSLRRIRDIEICGAGTDLAAAALLPYAHYDFLSDLSSSTWLQQLDEIVEKHAIEYLFLAHDQWIFELRNLAAVGGAALISTNARAIEICRFKSATYEALDGLILTPSLFDRMPPASRFPLFLKPDAGQGSVGARVVSGPHDLIGFVNDDGTICDGWILSELLTGDEVTVDCFSDNDSNVIYLSARRRDHFGSGLALRTSFVESGDFVDVGDTISRILGLTGAWFFQMKANAHGQWVLLEVAPRIAGSSGINRGKDVNLPLLSLLNTMGIPLSITEGSASLQSHKQLEDVFLLEQGFDHVFVDFDDTILINGIVNENLLRFLVHARNSGSELHLLTRHDGDISLTLEKIFLHGFFNSVIHITDGSAKSPHIFGTNPLFIDDSFSERVEVRENSPAIAVSPASFESRWSIPSAPKDERANERPAKHSRNL